MTVSFEKKLEELGFTVEPYPDLDTGKFVHARRAGNVVYTAGQVSSWDGRDIKGKVGTDLTLEEALEAARYSTLNNLRALKTLIGSLDNISHIVKVLGMVNVGEGFNETPLVMHGCSDLLRQVFGEEAGLHARSAVGMVLPFNYAVEIEMIVALKEAHEDSSR